MAYYNAGSEVNATSTADIVDEDEIVDDLSIVPLDKDSFAICELCGRVGRRRQFYPRNNKVCSLRCNASSNLRRRCSWRFKLMEGAEHMAGLIPLEPLPQLQQWHATLNDIQAGPIKQSAAQVANSYEWKDELFGCDFLAAPVSLFKHAPLHEMWDNTFEGMKVEVKNTDCDNYSEKINDFFWVATVLKVKGYMGLLRYEGFGSDDSKDFWVNLCCSEVHPVGWCATRGKPLIPPRSIEDKYTDWKKFLVKQLTGARTLPANFYTKLNDSLKSRFSIGSIMEVVDKNRISQVKVASVCEIIGKRLHVKYYDSSPEDNGFWCHEDSPLIHPVGWAFRVGHPLDAPQSYCHRVATGRFLPNDTTQEMFYKYPTNEPPLFVEGMKLEAIDPLNLSAVCAATVMQILNEGYMMIRIDCYPADASGGDWFCYHQRSPCIFPVGFALANNIPLVPPAGYTAEEFSWDSYLRECGGRAATRALFAARGHLVSHGFVCGMRLECADLMDPRLVCVATVARVVADLLKVHFDGWGSEYDQWLWAHSTDMYPVGWCRAVAHRLEGPMPPPPRAARKPPPKNQRRRRRQQVPKVQPQPPNTTEDSSQNSDMGDTKSLSPPTSVSEISADVESRPDDTESRPDDIESRPDDIDTRPDDIDSRPDDMESRPDDMDSRPDDIESRPDDMDSRPDDMESRPDDMDSRPDDTESRPDDMDTRPDDMESRPDNMDTRPDDMESRPDDMDSRPDDMESRPNEVESRPDNMESRPDEASKMDVEETTTEASQERLSEESMSIPTDASRGSSVGTAPASPDTSQGADEPVPRLLDALCAVAPDTSQGAEPVPRLLDALCAVAPDTSQGAEPVPRLLDALCAVAPDTSQGAEPVPRLLDAPRDALCAVAPERWSPADVARFLAVNDCQPYCDNFAAVTGPMLLQLSKDGIIELLEMKVGPSLKIFDLIQQLKCKIKQPQCRLNFK